MAMWQVRTGQIKTGKGREAMEWAKKVTGYINNTYPESNYEILSNIGSDLSQLHAISRFESLAQFEAYLAKLASDEKYLAIVQEMWDADLFTGWSDRLYQVRS
jgi:hypothetical protein